MEEINVTRKKWYARWWGISIIIFLVLFLAFAVTFGFYVKRLINENLAKSDIQSFLNSVSEEDLKIIEGPKANNWIGADDPLITIVEFSDFTCPLCKESYKSIREIALRNKDKIKFIYRDYPILSDNSMDLALVARCAGEQKMFWEMHDKLFQFQDEITSENLKSIVNMVNLRDFQFKKCIEEEKYLTSIKKDFADAQYLGAKGTPTWFINGHKIEGSIPYDTFSNLIEGLLKALEK